MNKVECYGYMEAEQWLPMQGHEGLYEISNYGRVKTLPRRRVTPGLLVGDISHGYVRYPISKYGKTKKVFAHRLVAIHFLGQPEPGKNVVNHIDGNRSNNFYKNLEWCDTSHNVKHAFRDLGREHTLHRRIEMSKGENTYIFKSYREAGITLGLSHVRIGAAVRAGLNFYKGYHIKIYDTKGRAKKVADMAPERKVSDNCKRYHEENIWVTSKAIEFEGCGIKKVYPSVKDACRELGLRCETVYNAIYKNRNLRKYKIRYV